MFCLTGGVMPGAGGGQATVPAYGPEGARWWGGGQGGGAEPTKYGNCQPAEHGTATNGAQHGSTADGTTWPTVAWQSNEAGDGSGHATWHESENARPDRAWHARRATSSKHWAAQHAGPGWAGTEANHAVLAAADTGPQVSSVTTAAATGAADSQVQPQPDGCIHQTKNTRRCRWCRWCWRG